MCVPLVNSRLERSGPPWNSARLPKLRNRKSRLFKNFVRSATDIVYALYSRARADYRRINQHCYEKYMIRVRSNFAGKSSLFPTKMFYGDVSSSSYPDISNMFADFLFGRVPL